MMLLLFTLISVALSACLDYKGLAQSFFEDTRDNIEFTAEDIRQYNAWNFPSELDVQAFAERLNYVIGTEWSDELIQTTEAYALQKVTDFVAAWEAANLNQTEIDNIRTCLQNDRDAIAALADSFLGNLTAAFASIRWPTEEWNDIRADAENSDEIPIIFFNWVGFFAGQLANRLKILALYPLAAAEEKKEAVLQAYDGVLDWITAEPATRDQSIIEARLEHFLYQTLNERRLRLTIQNFKTEWARQLEQVRDTFQAFKDGAQFRFVDFVENMREVLGAFNADSPTYIRTQQAPLFDFLAGYGINPDALMAVRTVYNETTLDIAGVSVLVNATLSLSFEINVPNVFDDVARAEEVGRHLQTLIARWLTIQFQLHPDNLAIEAYVVPPTAKRAANDQMTLVITTQSGASSMTAALVVLLLAMLFHWTG